MKGVTVPQALAWKGDAPSSGRIICAAAFAAL